MITDSEALRTFAAGARAAGVSALDTEFVWERTYYPALGLVQLTGEAGQTALVDPLAEMDLAPMAELIADADTVKILHDARQDLWIMRRYCGALPRNVFDTRLAAGFAGMSATTSLAALHEELLGVTLAKTQTRTNWLKRPLTPQQLAYAEEDVVHMPQLREILLEAVAERGREAWLAEEHAALEDEALYADPDLSEGYRRVKGAGRLRRSQLALLRELTIWRDSLAIRLDRPRGFILRDAELLAIAEDAPADLGRLRKLGVPHRTVERNGSNLLAIVRKAADLPECEWPESLRGERPDDRTKARINAAMDALRDRAERLAIDAAFIAPRADVTMLASADDLESCGSRLLSGWRREAAGDAVVAAIAAV